MGLLVLRAFPCVLWQSPQYCSQVFSRRNIRVFWIHVISAVLYHQPSVILFVTSWLISAATGTVLFVALSRGVPWKLLAAMKCESHATASVSHRHHHSLTLINEQKQVVPYQNFSTDHKCSHCGQQWRVDLPFLTSVPAVPQASVLLPGHVHEFPPATPISFTNIICSNVLHNV